MCFTEICISCVFAFGSFVSYFLSYSDLIFIYFIIIPHMLGFFLMLNIKAMGLYGS